jgi:hypothetical protein
VKVGLAKMAASKAPPASEPDDDDTESKALDQVISALQDDDAEGAKAALRVAIRACIASYGPSADSDEEDY